MVKVLLEKAKDSDERVRWEAVTALGNGRRDDEGADVVTTLIGALGDQSPWVRERAAQVLGRFRDERAVQPLVTLLKDSDPDVREEAVTAVGTLCRNPGDRFTHCCAQGPGRGRPRTSGPRPFQKSP